MTLLPALEDLRARCENARCQIDAPQPLVQTPRDAMQPALAPTRRRCRHVEPIRRCPLVGRCLRCGPLRRSLLSPTLLFVTLSGPICARPARPTFPHYADLACARGAHRVDPRAAVRAARCEKRKSRPHPDRHPFRVLAHPGSRARAHKPGHRGSGFCRQLVRTRTAAPDRSARRHPAPERRCRRAHRACCRARPTRSQKRARCSPSATECWPRPTRTAKFGFMDACRPSTASAGATPTAAATRWSATSTRRCS